MSANVDLITARGSNNRSENKVACTRCGAIVPLRRNRKYCPACSDVATEENKRAHYLAKKAKRQADAGSGNGAVEITIPQKETE